MKALTALRARFRRSRASKPARHRTAQLRAVSLACSHMDHSYGYSFWLRREEERWLLNAECFLRDFTEETALESRETGGQDLAELFAVMERTDAIARAENWKKPKAPPFQILDETVYSFGLSFSDGSRYRSGSREPELEQFFYRLAEKLAGPNP